MNNNSIFGYAYLLDGEVKKFSTDKKYTYASLNKSTEYSIQVVAMDKNWKAKYSNIVKASTTNLDYIKNGLILHYDGIDNVSAGNHNASTTTWYDLSGNGQNATLYNCVINANNVGFNGSNSYARLPANALGSWGASTIEIVAKVNNKSVVIADNSTISARGLALNSTNEMCISIRDNYNTFNSTQNLYGSNVLYDLIWNAANNNNASIYINTTSTSKTSNVTTFSSSSSYPVLGKRIYSQGSTWSLNGNIYSIRVYNRALTMDEIRNNYEMDKARFGI